MQNWEFVSLLEENARRKKKIQDSKAIMYQSMRNWEFLAHEKEMLQQRQEFKHLPDDLNGFEGFSEGTSSPS